MSNLCYTIIQIAFYECGIQAGKKSGGLMVCNLVTNVTKFMFGECEFTQKGENLKWQVKMFLYILTVNVYDLFSFAMTAFIPLNKGLLACLKSQWFC